MLKRALYLAPSILKRPPTTAHKLAITRSLGRIHAFPFNTNPKIVTDNKKEKELQRRELEINEEVETLVKVDLEKELEQRNKAVAELAKEKEYPEGALLTGILLTAPMLIGSLSLNAFVYTNMFLDMLPSLYIGLIKFSGLHLAFLVILRI